MLYKYLCKCVTKTVKIYQHLPCSPNIHPYVCDCKLFMKWKFTGNAVLTFYVGYNCKSSPNTLLSCVTEAIGTNIPLWRLWWMKLKHVTRPRKGSYSMVQSPRGHWPHILMGMCHPCQIFCVKKSYINSRKIGSKELICRSI